MGKLLRPPVLMHNPVPAPLASVAGAASIGPTAAAIAPSSLKILHVLRAPVGGLFRNVVDVAQGQAERGHRVGLIVDSTTGGARADALLAQLAPKLVLGVKRLAIARQPGIGDITAIGSVAAHIAAVRPDVLHGHGAKGGAVARLAPRTGGAIRVYTPHGGALGYAPGTLAGGFYRTLEWLLNWRTDLFLFESDYVAQRFREKVGHPRRGVRVVRNGVGDGEFAAVTARDDASDLVCVGELRGLKGFDVLIEALAMLKRSGRRVSAAIAGEGADGPQLEAHSHRLGIADQIRFVGHRPAREAFAMGHVLVVPSRAESLPYIVLEAAAAGIPIVATRVGGIPEIYGADAPRLVAPGDAAALAQAVADAFDDPAQSRRRAEALKSRVRAEFSVNAMVEGGLAAYREALSRRKLAQFT
jgi:glycosyltransferase involved in cell wall biosynthesis